MSEYWHPLPDMISSVQVENGAAHDKLTIFEKGGALAGVLTFSTGRAQEFLLLLTDPRPVLQTYWGGNTRGICVKVFREVPHNTQLISGSTGRVRTVDDLMAVAGARET